MNGENRPLRVLYSFPHKLGAGRICTTAWQQVSGLAAAGAQVLVFPGAIQRPVLAEHVRARPTLARGKIRIPYRFLGTMHSCVLHDWIVSRRVEKLAGQIDIIHTWPLGALRTLKTAARLGIPTVYERCNAHTRFAYEIMQKECEILGVKLPRDHEYTYRADVLSREEEEYQLADRLLCPSDFVARTYLEKGFPPAKLARHHYGYDPQVYFPNGKTRSDKRRFTLLFVGLFAEIKGLHYALEAWLQSPAHRDGTFLIVGGFSQAYAKKLSSQLGHPSVRVLGYRNDVPELMRSSDVLVLPSIQEGFGLVCTEAMGSGCVPLVSEVCTDVCKHMENSLVHCVGDVKALAEHITMLYKDPVLRERLRQGCLITSPKVTWQAAGVRLLQVYRDLLTAKKAPSQAWGLKVGV